MILAVEKVFNLNACNTSEMATMVPSILQILPFCSLSFSAVVLAEDGVEGSGSAALFTAC